MMTSKKKEITICNLIDPSLSHAFYYNKFKRTNRVTTMQETCLEIYGFTIIMSDIGLYTHINVVVPRVTICLNQRKYGKYQDKISSYSKRPPAI